MGSPSNETGHYRDEGQHQVSLTKGFFLGKYEVTQAQYLAVMTGNTDLQVCEAKSMVVQCQSPR